MTFKFDQLLEAVENLPDDEQADLVDVIQRRLAKRGRKRVVGEVHKARKEFAAGKCKTTTVHDLMREIES